MPPTVKMILSKQYQYSMNDFSKLSTVRTISVRNMGILRMISVGNISTVRAILVRNMGILRNISTV